MDKNVIHAKVLVDKYILRFDEAEKTIEKSLVGSLTKEIIKNGLEIRKTVAEDTNMEEYSCSIAVLNVEEYKELLRDREELEKLHRMLVGWE